MSESRETLSQQDPGGQTFTKGLKPPTSVFDLAAVFTQTPNVPNVIKALVLSFWEKQAETHQDESIKFVSELKKVLTQKQEQY